MHSLNNEHAVILKIISKCYSHVGLFIVSQYCVHWLIYLLELWPDLQYPRAIQPLKCVKLWSCQFSIVNEEKLREVD